MEFFVIASLRNSFTSPIFVQTFSSPSCPLTPLFYFDLRERFSHPYEMKDDIILLYFAIFTFINSKREHKQYQTKL